VLLRLRLQPQRVLSSRWGAAGCLLDRMLLVLLAARHTLLLLQCRNTCANPLLLQMLCRRRP
jgi:hypothetical protein